MAAGAVASQAEGLKMVKYLGTPRHIVFTPIKLPLKCHGVLGPLSLIFLKELGLRLSAATVDTKSSSIVQWLYKGGNAASIRGTHISPHNTDF